MFLGRIHISRIKRHPPSPVGHLFTKLSAEPGRKNHIRTMRVISALGTLQEPCLKSGARAGAICARTRIHSANPLPPRRREERGVGTQSEKPEKTLSKGLCLLQGRVCPPTKPSIALHVSYTHCVAKTKLGDHQLTGRGGLGPQPREMCRCIRRKAHPGGDLPPQRTFQNLPHVCMVILRQD